MVWILDLFAPDEESAIRSSCRQWIKRRLMRLVVEEVGFCIFFWPTRGDCVALDKLGYPGCRIVQISHQDGLSWADHDTGGLETHVDSVGTEITFLGRMIFRVYEDRVIGTGCDTSLAADADRFVEVYDAVVAPIHRSGGAGCGTGCVRALVTTGDLEGSLRLREDPYIDIFYVGSGDGKRDFIFGFTGCRTSVTTDTTGIVDDFGPLDWEFGLRI